MVVVERKMLRVIQNEIVCVCVCRNSDGDGAVVLKTSTLTDD